MLKCNKAFLQIFCLGFNNEIMVLDKQAIIRNDQAISSSPCWCIFEPGYGSDHLPIHKDLRNPESVKRPGEVTFDTCQ